jgi:pSer/pThr/pTyr-binding forkhead associated (FHA) protein
MPAKIVLTLNSSVLGEYPLDKERITIGRRPRPHNDIQIDNLAVSGRHAAVITILNDSFLQDMESTNGTFVNGKLVKKCALHDGDMITIGKYELKYFNDEASDDQDFEKTMIISTDMLSHAAASRAHQQAEAAGASQPEAEKAPLARLQVLSGPSKGKELALEKTLMTLGKPGVQVAVITRRPRGYFLTHVEGTYPAINGNAINDEAHELGDHDVIELAGVKVAFYMSN